MEVTTDDRAVDMVEEAYDLVIRVNLAPDDALVARAFIHDRLVVVAAPDLHRSADASVAAVLHGVIGQIQAWEMATASGKAGIQVDLILGLSSLVMVRDAVRAGAGVARLPLSLVSHDLVAGILVHWGDIEGPGTTLWALYPSRRLLSSRISAFLDHLKEAFPQGTPKELAAYIAP